MPEPVVQRHGPLSGVVSDDVLSVLPPMARFVFRGGAAAALHAGMAFGVPLPAAVGRAERRGERAALWLGPDEWLLLAPPGDESDLARRIVAAVGGTPHALVDIGHRDAAIAVAGPSCAAIVSTGCPLDLDDAAFPAGMCTRTVFARVGIVLWRCDPQRFRIEVARSYAGYVWALLDEARRTER